MLGPALRCGAFFWPEAGQYAQIRRRRESFRGYLSLSIESFGIVSAAVKVFTLAALIYWSARLI